MKSSKGWLIKAAVMLVFLCCMLFANLIAVRMIFRYVVDAYFYDKLLVAYTIGGVKGLEMELEKIPVTDNLAREKMLAKDFTARLATLASPEAYLTNKVEKSRKAISSIRNLRGAAGIVILLIFGWRLFVNFSARFKRKKRR